jgi:hypothetical protein
MKMLVLAAAVAAFAGAASAQSCGSYSTTTAQTPKITTPGV